MVGYVRVLREKYPNVGFSCVGNVDDYDNLLWTGGDPLPSQETLDADKLDVHKNIRKSEVNAFRTEYMTDYFTYDGKQWDCDDAGLTNIIGILLLGVISGNTLPEGTVFRDYNNTNHVVTFMYMAVMASTLMTFKQSVYAHSWSMKAEIDALTSVSAVKNYDITVGWPSK